MIFENLLSSELYGVVAGKQNTGLGENAEEEISRILRLVVVSMIFRAFAVSTLPFVVFQCFYQQWIEFEARLLRTPPTWHLLLPHAYVATCPA